MLEKFMLFDCVLLYELRFVSVKLCVLTWMTVCFDINGIGKLFSIVKLYTSFLQT